MAARSKGHVPPARASRALDVHSVGMSRHYWGMLPAEPGVRGFLGYFVCIGVGYINLGPPNGLRLLAEQSNGASWTNVSPYLQFDSE